MGSEMLKKIVVARLETLTKNLPGESKENHEDFRQVTWCSGRDSNGSFQTNF